MSRLNERLTRLEIRLGQGARQVTVINRCIVEPGPEGPKDTGQCLISVIGSADRFSSERFESEGALWASVNECHQRIHSAPVSVKADHAA